MREIVETIAKELVEHPDRVQVKVSDDAQIIHIELKVDQSDMGKVIGKQGRIAKAIRTVLKAVAMKDDRSIHLEIVEHEGQLG